MPAKPESFDKVAQQLGYSGEAELLKDMYERQGFSFNTIAKTLGYSPALIRLRCLQAGIKFRPKGGWNNTKKETK